MPFIYALLWDLERPYEGYDIHLVPGQTSAPLLDSLVLEYDTAADLTGPRPIPSSSLTWKRAPSTQWQADGVAGTAIFTPVFPFTVASHGIEVDPGTGRITTTNAVTTRRGVNFLIGIRLNQTGPAVPATLTVRVHVHFANPEVILAPSPLTVHPGAQPVRFSILARFRNGEEAAGPPPGPPNGPLADLSRQPGFRIAGVTGPIVVVNRQGVPDPNGLWIMASGAAQPGNTAEVVMDNPFGAQIRGQVAIGERWLQPRTVLPINRKSRPTAGEIAARPNVLFLSDGFLATERELFLDCVRFFVNQIARSAALTPFRHLTVNYYALLLPSRERGSNVLSEMMLRGAAPAAVQAVRSLHILPEPPPSNQISTPAHLLYKVGLPLTNLAGPAVVQDWEAIWNANFAPGYVSYAPGLTPADIGRVVGTWAALRNRALLRDQDTFLGIRNGERPKVFPEAHHVMGWHPFRATRADLDRLLEQVSIAPATAPDGSGATWAAPKAKDRNLVCVISAGGPRGGTNQRDDLGFDEPTPNGDFRKANALVPIALSDDSRSNTNRAGVFAVLDPRVPVPTAISIHALGVLVHEVAHSLGCGDEYGGQPAFGNPADDAAAVKPWANLAELSQVLTPATRAERLRWNWNRVRAAAIVHEVTLSGSVFTMRLRRGDGRFLRAFFNRPPGTQRAYLRHRPLADFYPYTTFPPLRSPRFTLEKSRITASSLTMSIDDATEREIFRQWTTTVAPPEFAEGIVLFVPRLAPTTLEEELLVAPLVMTHLVNKPVIGEGMNVRRANRGTPLPPRLPGCGPDPQGIQEVEPVAGVTLARMTDVVGLFTGGATVDCRIFHATARCLMRDSGQTAAAVVFCHVCRYLLVDRITPSAHKLIDDEYSAVYPR